MSKHAIAGGVVSWRTAVNAARAFSLSRMLPVFGVLVLGGCAGGPPASALSAATSASPVTLASSSPTPQPTAALFSPSEAPTAPPPAPPTVAAPTAPASLSGAPRHDRAKSAPGNRHPDGCSDPCRADKSAGHGRTDATVV